MIVGVVTDLSFVPQLTFGGIIQATESVLRPHNRLTALTVTLLRIVGIVIIG